jgi:Melibiase
LSVLKSMFFVSFICFLPLMIFVSCGDDDDSGDDDGDPTDDDVDDDEDDDASDDPVVEYTNGKATVTIDRIRGLFDIAFNGYTFVEKATSVIETGTTDPIYATQVVHAPNASLDGLLPVTTSETQAGTLIELRYPKTEHGQITTYLTLMADGGGLLARMDFTANDVDDLVSLIPIYIGPETGGGLFMKSDPSDVQVLQNGSEISYDFYADLQYADYPYSRGMLKQYLTEKPSSAANWNALLYDRANEESLHMGYLSFESVVPQVVIGYDSSQNPMQSGIEGWFTFQSRNGYIIARNEAPGALRSSELFWMDLFEGRPHIALETYARMIADEMEIELNHAPVVSWDSWYVYGDRIDQEIILENLDGISEKFGDYGMTSMQVDLGWEKIWGNWTSDNRFPDGMNFLSQRIKDAGLIPELWVSPTNVMRSADVLREHPEWAGRVHPIYYLMIQPFSLPLDLTRPDVIDFVASTGELFAGYGFEGVKYDFAYYEVMLSEVFDPSVTIIEAYRRAVMKFRDSLGWDKFFINLLLNGVNYGIADAMRISIDSWPCWGDTVAEGCPESNNTNGYDGFGIRIILKQLARRYYLNNVIWVNHPDQMFFREHLGLIPHRSWGTVVALSGAVMSLGEEIASMSPEEVDTFRRLIPNLGITGVPRDLFDREYPEVWLTPLISKNPGGHLLHLYSWGNNWDRTINPPTEIQEGTRHHVIALSDLELEGPFHAFEFWTQSDLGVINNNVEIDVPARDSRVIILRPVQDRPYLLSSNRHVSQGGVDLHDPNWDSQSGTLSWTQDIVTGFEHQVYVAPSGFEVVPVVSISDGSEVSLRNDGNLWVIEIVPAATGTVNISLIF